MRFQRHDARDTTNPPVKGPIEAPMKAQVAYATLYFPLSILFVNYCTIDTISLQSNQLRELGRAHIRY
jgi:hypothetical protein